MRSLNISVDQVLPAIHVMALEVPGILLEVKGGWPAHKTSSSSS
jgi:hypothetical protein